MQKIIIDTDPGIDDALAILLALAAKDELDVLALTTVNGNVGVEQVTKNAFKILEIAGRTDIPVYMGNGKPLMRENEHCEEFHGDDGMGNLEMPDCHKIPENENAVDFLIRKVREEKGEITLVPIGPLTNIAEAIQKNSDFVKNVKEVVIMGGAEHGGNMSPHAEFNFWTDPEAAKIVFQAGFEKVTMIGLDATSYVFLSPTLRELLYLINTPIQLMKNMGKTVVLVEHKMEQIAEYADHVVVMDKGKIVLEGTAKEVFSNPKCMEYHTRLPQSTKIAMELMKEGIPFQEIPVTVDETIQILNSIMGKGV